MDQSKKPHTKEERKRYMYEYFKGVARQHNARFHPINIKSFFDDTGRKRAIIVMPQSAGDCFLITALFESFKETYPEYDLYVATNPKFFQMFEGNPYVYKTIPFVQAMENELYLIGQGDNPGVVDLCFLPFIQTQKILNYLRNGEDKIAFNIKK